MANRWPEGGESPLTRREKMLFGALAAFVVSIPLDIALLIMLDLMGPPPSWPMILVTCAIGLAAGATWIRPWEAEPPRRR